MTKEELEKEEEDFADSKNSFWRQGRTCIDSVKQAYIAGAEPREKRIAELESTNKKISDECHKLVDTLEKKQNKNELLETQNIKLQAEVSKLTIKNADLIGKIAFTENALNNAKAQIKKMKRHANCKYCDSEGYCEVRRTYLIDLSYNGCDKWELED